MLRWAHLCALFLFVAAEKTTSPTKRGKSLFNYSRGSRGLEPKGPQNDVGRDVEQGAAKVQTDGAKRFYDPSFGSQFGLPPTIGFPGYYGPTGGYGSNTKTVDMTRYPSYGSPGGYGRPVDFTNYPAYGLPGGYGSQVQPVDFTDYGFLNGRSPGFQYSPTSIQNPSSVISALSSALGRNPVSLLQSPYVQSTPRIGIPINLPSPYSSFPSNLYGSQNNLGQQASQVAYTAKAAVEPGQLLSPHPDVVSAARVFISPGTYYPTFQGNPFAPPPFFGPNPTISPNTNSQGSQNSLLSVPSIQQGQQLGYQNNLQPSMIPNLQQLIQQLASTQQSVNSPLSYPVQGSSYQGQYNLAPSAVRKAHR
ncbi:hypothetical protein GE061_011722 [Apolygus lucorum]|uniref:Uncharacterized protein n=1 Tax=Apolygus lucorum TaxID=248454 RepID=A0A6A4JSE3_APOLU|nr:hypothetical protein GE061_011722 [Apolygus lucorum]